MRTARLLLAALLVVVVTPVALGTAPACAVAGDARLAIAVVVDFGGLAGAPADPSTSCVAVADGATGADVLEARARQLGTPPPRYDASGLLCTIDGVPATGCGDRTETGYRYWSYWQGSERGWEYAAAGPAFRQAGEAVVEGWHFVDGSGRPNDPPPDGPPDHGSTCGPTSASRPPAGALASSNGVPVGAALGALLAVGLAVGGTILSRLRASANRRSLFALLLALRLAPHRGAAGDPPPQPPSHRPSVRPLVRR